MKFSTSTPSTVECSAWYLVTTYIWPDGSTTKEEEYLGTTCEDSDCGGMNDGLCPPDSENGGGSDEECQNNINNFSSSAVANNISISVQEMGNTRTLNYTWEIHRQIYGLWKFQSHDQAVHQNINGDWQFKSLSHLSISKQGYAVGGEVNCTLISATPTVGIYNAIMEIQYQLEKKIECRGIEFSSNDVFTAKKPWNVNDR